MEKTLQYTDQLGRNIEVQFPPKRIISLVPSQTELLFDLELHKHVVGITKFCIHPEGWFKSKPRVGGTKNLNFQKIKELNPDLIIANKEENDQGQIEFLSKDYPVWISDVNDLPSSIDMIRSVADICGRSDRGNRIILDIQTSFSSLNNNLGSAIYVIWYEPLMVVGSDTFVFEMMKCAGFKNAVKQSRYPEMIKTEMRGLNPDFILLSSEPYPFNKEHQISFQSMFPESKIVLVDGEMFSWYGSRLKQAPHYFKALACQLKGSD